MRQHHQPDGQPDGCRALDSPEVLAKLGVHCDWAAVVSAVRRASAPAPKARARAPQGDVNTDVANVKISEIT